MSDGLFWEIFGCQMHHFYPDGNHQVSAFLLFMALPMSKLDLNRIANDYNN
jgi:hypothetical protein